MSYLILTFLLFIIDLQVYVRIKDEEWNVYKRYTQFREQHMKLRKSHPVVSTFEFPPKKAIGSKVRFLKVSGSSLFNCSEGST